MALSVEAPHVSHVSPSPVPKVLALRPPGVVGGVVSPVADSRSVIARSSTPKNASPFQVTVTKASQTALPVWNVPCEAVIERSNERVWASQVGVKNARPSAVPSCDTAT